jgi:hypothetical protein
MYGLSSSWTHHVWTFVALDSPCMDFRRVGLTMYGLSIIACCVGFASIIIAFCVGFASMIVAYCANVGRGLPARGCYVRVGVGSAVSSRLLLSG